LSAWNKAAQLAMPKAAMKKKPPSHLIEELSEVVALKRDTADTESVKAVSANEPVTSAKPVTETSLPRRGPRYRRQKSYRAILARIFSDLAGTEITETKRQMIHRFAALTVATEELEAGLIDGRKIDVDQLATLCSTLNRLALRIGIKVEAKGDGVSLGEYLQDRTEPPDDDGGQDG
jgi:hypothetical protein